MSDYLWDRSGEPDQEIQQLEEILAPLGYQPRPLEIPAGVRPEQRRTIYLRMGAIAAVVALAALALGVWLSINRAPSVQPSQAIVTPGPEQNVSPGTVAAGPHQEEPLPADENRAPRVDPPVYRATDRNVAGSDGRHRRDPRQSQPNTRMTAARREEAVAAKEQLMMALRLASAKLNQAQKRTTSGYPENFIRNQHKVG